MRPLGPAVPGTHAAGAQGPSTAAAAVARPAQGPAPEAPVRLTEAAVAGAVWTPNARAHFAWELREHLQAAAGATHGESAEVWRGVLARLERGEIARDAASRALFQLAVATSESALGLDPERAAQRLLALSPAQLRAALDGLAPPAAVAVRTQAPGADGKRRFGQELARTLATRSLPAGPEVVLPPELSYAPPWAFGAAAENLGLATPAALLAVLATSERTAVVDAIAAKASEYLDMQAASQPVSSQPDLAGARQRLAELGQDPKRSPALLAQQEQLAGLISGLTKTDRDSAALAMSARQRQASHFAGRVLSDLERAAGPELAAAVLQRFDLDAEVARLADLRQGRSVITDLEARGPFVVQSERLMERLAGEAVRRLADGLVTALAARPALAAALDGDSPGARELRAAMLRYAADVPPEEGESLAAYSSRLLSRRAELLAWAERLGAEHDADPEGFTAALRGFRAEKEQLAEAVATAGAHKQARAAELSAHVLALPMGVIREVREHAARCYPSEAMGYLVAAGAEVFLLPIRNQLHGTEEGRVKGLEVREDAEAMERLVGGLGLEVVAKFHSHPEDSPVFSNTDLDGMRDAVALLPGLRSLIVGVSEKRGQKTFSMASFASDTRGQLVGEDDLHVTS